VPIGSIISSPNADTINAAYRPIIIRVAATRTNGDPIPPVVYCDVYINDVFYRTISKSQYTKLNALDSEWQFDIQDLLQEYLGKYLAENGEELIKEAVSIVAKVLCRLRSSGYDANGFIIQEDIAPVQGTDDEDPVDGTGTAVNTFYVVNATLQHEDNQDLATHLATYRNRTWSTNSYPLTHRPDHHKICRGASDSFPIITDRIPSILVLNYRPIGSGTWLTDEIDVCEPVALVGTPTLPDGEEDTSYFYVIFLTGTLPFAITDVIKPSWMTITLFDGQVRFTGTPATGDIGTDIDVSFKITNCSNGEVDFADVINVTALTCVPAALAGATTLPDANNGLEYDAIIPLVGTAPVNIDNAILPVWMSVIVEGGALHFFGMPTGGDIMDNVSIHVEFSNACGNAEFNDTIDVH
jgi:hypothetical protein